METLRAIAILIVIAVFAKFILTFVLNIVGVPGALIAGKREKTLTARYLFGCLIATIGQSIIYLTYTTGIVKWTSAAIARQGVSPIVLWPVAFLCVTQPIWWTFIAASAEAKMEGYGTNAQIEAVGFTSVLAVIGFFIFAFVPSTMGWLVTI